MANLPALEPGVYTVMWRALSDIDGHLSQGITVFSLGHEMMAGHGAAQHLSATQPELPVAMEAALRWSNYLLLASLLGGIALAVLVLSPADQQPAAQGARLQQRLYGRTLRWSALCAVGAFMVGIGLLLWQVVSFQPLSSASGWQQQVQPLLLQSQWGRLWLARQTLLLFLSGGLWFLARSSATVRPTWQKLLVFGRASDLMIVQALAGHAASDSHHWLLALTNATLHLLAAGVWIGGLITLAVVVLPAQARHKASAPQWQPVRWQAFSLLALGSVGLLFATGLYSMGRQVASVDALLDSQYGQLLLGKIGLVLLIGLCGIGNTLLLHPKLAAGIGAWIGRPAGWRPAWARLHPARLIAVEVLLGVLLFGFVGLLTATAPPRDAAYTIDPAQLQPALTQRVDNLLVTLAVSPNQLGQNLINVRAVDPAQPLSSEIAVLYVQLKSPGANAAPVKLLANKLSNAEFQVIGTHLTQAGPWQFEVIAERYGKPDAVAAFQWIVPPAGELQPVRISKAPLAPLANRLALGFLVALALITVGVRWLIQRQARLGAAANAASGQGVRSPTMPVAQKPVQG
ncbi:MAG: CopD family protein [Caldilineaceae bacterium]